MLMRAVARAGEQEQQGLRRVGGRSSMVARDDGEDVWGRQKKVMGTGARREGQRRGAHTRVVGVWWLAGVWDARERCRYKSERRVCTKIRATNGTGLVFVDDTQGTTKSL